MRGLSFGAWPYLLLLLLLPAAWLVSRRRRLRLPFPGAARAGRERRVRLLAAGPLTLRTLAIGLVVVALASPLRRLQRVESRSEGVAVVLAFDISSSMLAEDFRPDNRLAVARREVKRFVEGREGDRIGLVAFAGEALTVVPGTLDHEVVLAAVENLDVGQLEDGTAIGTALATATNRLRKAEAASRVVILLTDGDNNRGSISPLAAAAAAAALGVRVYTIGVGRKGVAPVPIGRTRFGYQYANMEVNVNDELLEAMARASGGLYFRATDPEALSRIYDRIDELETAPLTETRVVEVVGASAGLLWLALGLLAAELVLAATRARRVLAA
ncbi:MAG: VWA domain-containing protein [Gemmatimonadota bacterium]